MNIPKLLIAVLVTIFMGSKISSAQGSSNIYGYIVDSLNNPITNAYITALSTLDSVVVESIMSNEKGYFQFNNHHKISQIFLIVKMFGYEPAKLDLTENRTYPIYITLTAQNYDLPMIVVTWTQQPLSVSKGSYVLNVNNTYLKDMPDIWSILKFAPNVRFNQADSMIEVIGSGTPLIIIDGKESTVTEFQAINPQQIKKIKINKNPSAKYESKYNSIIEVALISNKKQGVSLSVQNKFSIGRRFNDLLGVNISHKTKHFDNTLIYQYTLMQPKNRYELYETSYYIDSTIGTYTSGVDMPKRNSHNIIVGTQYTINPRNQIDLQYNFSDLVMSSNSISQVNRSINDALLQTSNIQKRGPYHTQNNILSLGYNHRFDSASTLQFFINYGHKKIDSNTEIEEENESVIENRYLYANGKSEALIFRAEYTTSLFQHDITIGARYSNLRNNHNTQYINVNIPGNDVQTTKVKDDIGAIFISAERRFDKFEYELGFRAESNKNYIELSDGNIVNPGYKLNLFPTIQLSYNPNSKVQINVNYASKISRPSFAELSPRVNYVNEYAYSIGNPKLSSTISNSLTLNSVFWRKLNLSFKYSILRDYRLWVVMNDPNSPDILMSTPQNIDYVRSFLVSASYSNKFKFYSLTLSGDMTLMNIPNANDLGLVKQRPTFYADISNVFEINSQVDVYLNFSTTSRFYDVNISGTPTYYLSLGMNCRFGKRFSLSLEINDLLHRDTGDWFEQYLNVHTAQYNDRDTRRLSLMLKYNFSNYKNAFRRNRNTEPDINRL